MIEAANKPWSVPVTAVIVESDILPSKPQPASVVPCRGDRFATYQQTNVLGESVTP